MAGQPIDSQEFNRAVQRAVESSYTRTFTHVNEIYRRLSSLERTERANLVSIDNLTQLPPAHKGGLAFVKDEAAWYYCDGVAWTQVAGGSGGDMAVHVLASNVALGPYHNIFGATDGDVLRATSSTAARFMRLAHDDLDGVSPNQHHAKLHDVTDNSHHTITAADWGMVGAVGANAIGIRNPSADVTGVTKEALLKSDGNGYLSLVRSIASDRMQTPQVESAAGDLTVTAANDVVVTPSHWTMFADNVDMRSQSHLAGFLGQGWRISWPEVDRPHLDIRSIYAEELEVTAFQADIMRVRIAEDFLTQGMAFTAEAFVTPHAVGGEVRVLFEGNPVLGAAQLFLPNEWVMFNLIQRDAGLVVAQIWGQVSDYLAELPDANGVARQSWKFTLRNGPIDFVVPKGNICLAWGVSGQKNGYIHHNVLSTANGPWTRYATWTGSDPYTVANRRYHVQTGNLHGLVDIATDRYGIAAGDNLAKTPNDPTNPFKGFTADNVGGMRLFNTDISAYVGAVQKMYIAASGQEMWLGTSSTDKRFNYLDGDLTVVGTLEAAGHQFRADEDGVKIKVSPGSMFEGLDESVQWLYNSLDTGLRTWIGTRVYGSGDADSQLSLAAIGAEPGAWGTIAMRAREYGQSPLLDTEGATFIVTPRNIWVGPQAGMRLSTIPSDIMTPVPGGQLYAETIYAGDITVTGTISGQAMNGASWEYPGDMLVNAHAATNTTVTINNLGVGRADLVVDRDIIVGGNVDGVDLSAFYSAYTTHAANANAHHNQAHAYDSADHTGTLSWTKLSKVGASLADLPTRNYVDLNSRSHVLATNTALGGDHTISGATAGHVLRASAATAAAFAQLQHGDLGGVTADQHHAQVHAIISSNHTITGTRYQIVGIPTSDNVLGLLTPASTGNDTILKTDATGGVSLTNLTVANAILANGGVDYGANVLAEDVTYLQLAGTKALNTAVTLRADYWSLTPAGTLTLPTISAVGELVVNPASDLIFAPNNNNTIVAEGVWLTSGNYASETTGWGISPSGVADVRALLANEIVAKSFIVDLEQALAGGEIVTKSVTKLAQAYVVPHATTTAITFRAKATATTLTNTLTVTKPLGVLQYDFMIAHIVLPSTSTVLTWPTNWVKLVDIASVTTRLCVFIFTAGAAEGASYAWTFSAAGETTGTIQAFYGVNPGDPIVAYSTQSGNGVNAIVPGITTALNGVGMVYLAGMYDTTNLGTTSTPPAGSVEREDALGAAHTWLTAADSIQATLGLAGNPFATLTVSHPWAAALLALKPATWNTTRFIVEDLPSATGMAVFEAGDIVRLRQFSRAGGGLTVTDCWGVVNDYVSNGDGTQSWTFARSATPNAGLITVGAIISAGSLVLDYGKDGDGFYEINAYSGTYASTAPYSQVVKWTGHPATGQVVRVREGNLEGITAQVDEYGLWAGAKGAAALGTADQYIRVSNMGVLINNVPIKLYNGAGVQTINLNSDGTAWFKDGAGNLKMNWDGSTLAITGQITATAGAIGGWTLAATYLTSTNIGLYSGTDARLEVGAASNIAGVTGVGTTLIWAGSTYANKETAAFRVSNTGVLSATGAVLSGSLSAGGGGVLIDSLGTGLLVYSHPSQGYTPTDDKRQLAWYAALSPRSSVANARIYAATYGSPARDELQIRTDRSAASGQEIVITAIKSGVGSSELILNSWNGTQSTAALTTSKFSIYGDMYASSGIDFAGSTIWFRNNPRVGGASWAAGSTIWHSGNFNATDMVATSLQTTGASNAIWVDSRDGYTQFGIYNTTNQIRFWTSAGDRAWIDTGGTVYAAGSYYTAAGTYYSGTSAHLFYNNSGSGWGNVTVGNLGIANSGLYADSGVSVLTNAGAASQVRAGNLLVSSDYGTTYTGRVPSMGIYTRGGIAIATSDGLTAGYILDVSSAARFRGSIAANVHINMTPIAAPAASGITGILYVSSADNRLHYIRPGGGDDAISP